MLSNDIINEAIHNMHNREKKDQSGSNGGRQRQKSKFKLKGIKNSKSQLARGYFVEDMMNKIYDLVKGQLDSDFSYLVKPGEEPLEDQMTLENYMSNWYTEYTRGLDIGQKLKSYSNRIFKVMQEQWDEGTYKESLMRDLANATWLATQAPENEPTLPEPETDQQMAQANDAADERGPDVTIATPNNPVADTDMAQANDRMDYGDVDGEYDPSVNYNIPAYKRQGKKIKGVKESKTQSALRAEKIPALKTR